MAGERSGNHLGVGAPPGGGAERKFHIAFKAILERHLTPLRLCHRAAIPALALAVSLVTAKAGDPTSWTVPGLTEPNQVYLPGPPPGMPHSAWLEQLRAYREAMRHPQAGRPALDRQIYLDLARRWLQGAFTCHFTFMYDRSFWDPEKGRYRWREFLREGEREFGGYDAILLWHAYPRLGIDPRNQLDFYRDMPGGLDGLQKLVRGAHRAGTRVFINYNPWDTGTRREPVPDEQFLAELVARTEMDGVFLDTMTGDSPALGQALDRVRPGTCLCPELHPALASLSWCNGSWSQGLDGGFPPAAIDHRKWLVPEHLRWHIDRWNPDHREEIRRAFFNAGGLLVWENIFGSYNPWQLEGRRLWRRTVAILRQFQQEFTSDQWEPFFPLNLRDTSAQTSGTGNLAAGTGHPAIFCNRWQGDGVDIYLLLSSSQHPGAESQTRRLAIPRRDGASYYDAWNGTRIEPKIIGDVAEIEVNFAARENLGCVVVMQERRNSPAYQRFLHHQSDLPHGPGEIGAKRLSRSLMDPLPPKRTTPPSQSLPPPGMVRVPATAVRLQIEHQRRECGCYPDPGTPPHKQPAFLTGNPFYQILKHDYTVQVREFFIDEAQVSNAEFQKFLAATHYRPKQPENFLKHWPDRKMPPAIADLPVVYVDLDDGRAYAKWAGKRLPTEPEWQLAAQGTDGRSWPWGGTMKPDKPDPDKVNTTGAPLPARSLPAGRSPFGCYHMSGNVYEWTESQRDDGHTRFAIIRGGSYFQARGSIWYADGGPRPCNHHCKFILMWPGLDRCATIGFRCVKDA